MNSVGLWQRKGPFESGTVRGKTNKQTFFAVYPLQRRTQCAALERTPTFMGTHVSRIQREVGDHVRVPFDVLASRLRLHPSPHGTHVAFAWQMRGTCSWTALRPIFTPSHDRRSILVLGDLHTASGSVLVYRQALDALGTCSDVPWQAGSRTTRGANCAPWSWLCTLDISICVLVNCAAS